MKVQRQKQLGRRGGEVAQRLPDMDVDTDMVHEQWEDYEGSENGDPPGRGKVDDGKGGRAPDKYGGYEADGDAGPHKMTGGTAPDGDDGFDGDSDADVGDSGGDDGDGSRPSGETGERGNAKAGDDGAGNADDDEGRAGHGGTVAHQTRTRQNPIHRRGTWIWRCRYRCQKQR